MARAMKCAIASLRTGEYSLLEVHVLKHGTGGLDAKSFWIALDLQKIRTRGKVGNFLGELHISSEMLSGPLETTLCHVNLNPGPR